MRPSPAPEPRLVAAALPFVALALVSSLLAACSARPPAWSVRDGVLRAPDGRAAVLRGFNVSGAQKNAPYLDDTQADYQAIGDTWGMNAVRFVMTWAAVEPSAGHYDDHYLDGVATRMGWAESAGLAVVLDMHEDVYGEGFGFDGAPRWTCDAARYAAFVPRMPWFVDTVDPNVEACVDGFYTRADLRQRFAAAWHHVAERLGKQPAVIGFDVLNEPEWGSYPISAFESDRLAPLYRDVVASVRQAAPGWVAFLEPSASRNVGVATGLTAFDFADVMYAPHSYDQTAESGGGFDPAHRQQILDNVAQLAGEARALDAGLWIGEYGGVASAPGIADYMTAQYDAAGRAAASTMYWSYDRSDGYGALAPDGTPKPALLDVLVRPYPARVAGVPQSYAFDAATATFTLSYAPDRTSRLPTEIIVPARVYPGGYSVECGGCQHTARGDTLSLTTALPGGTVTVVIHP